MKEAREYQGGVHPEEGMKVIRTRRLGAGTFTTLQRLQPPLSRRIAAPCMTLPVHEPSSPDMTLHYLTKPTTQRYGLGMDDSSQSQSGGHNRSASGRMMSRDNSFNWGWIDQDRPGDGGGGDSMDGSGAGGQRKKKGTVVSVHRHRLTSSGNRARQTRVANVKCH